MTDATPVLAAIATTALLLGGGIAMAAPFGDQIEDELDTTSRTETEASTQGDDDGSMTVETSEETHEGTEATAPPFYASRVVTIAGQLTLDELLVDLAATNGDVQVRTETGDAYALVANLTGYGATPDQARENRDEMAFVWDAGTPGDRQLVGHVEHDQDDDSGPLSVEADRKEADLTLVVPEDVRLSLSADTTNGAVDVRGLVASDLILDSTNGGVTVTDTHARDIQVDTTNGAVDLSIAGSEDLVVDSTNGDVVATITPGEDGTIEADSTNGNVDLSVPETAEHGYDVTATTTNGQASIGLEDGDKRTSDDGRHVTFRTHGFDERAVQTSILASSTNGNAHVGPS